MRERDPAILQRVQAVGSVNVRMSVMVMAEIVAGAKRHPAREAALIADFTALTAHIAVEPWTPACVAAYAEIDYQLRRIGKPIGVMDMLIAAQARAFDAVLVSNNLRHFERIRGLKLENWV